MICYPSADLPTSCVRNTGLRGPAGLYDPAFEHDACGVAFVADVAGRRSHDVVAKGLARAAPARPPRRPRRRAEHRRRRRHHDPDPGRVLPRRGRLRPAAARRVRDRSGVPADQRDRRGAEPSPCWRSTRGWAAPTCSAGATCRCNPRGLGASRRRRAGRGSGRCSWLRTDADRRPAAPASTWTGSCSRPQGRRAGDRRARHRRALPVPVQPHHRLQGHVDPGPGEHVLPRPVRRAGDLARSRWCTRASPPTRSRPGRWPTRTGSSPTTVRSTRSAATGTGWPRARRCWPPTSST